jgi:DNA polymerase III epsilon subunit-like protein
VKPKERVTDYRTWVSGVTEADLRGEGAVPAATFEEVQKQTAALLKDRILVGHAVQNDLKVRAARLLL